MFSCILLAAGESSRFGSPKALAPYHQKTVIEHLQEILISSQVDEIVIVLGAHQDKIKPFLLNHKKVKVVYNKDYKLGQTSSFQAGLRALEAESAGVLLLPVDYPAIKSATINHLLDHYRQHLPLIIIPACHGKKGHPPLFGADLKDEFLHLETSHGLNEIAHRHADQVTVLEIEDEGVCQTFNTQDELDQVS